MRILAIIITKLFRMIPERIAVSLGLIFGWILYRVVKFRHEVIHNQLVVAYGEKKGEKEIERLTKGIYRHLGLMLVEFLRLPRISAKELKSKVIIHGDDIVRKAIAKGKGVLALTGHIGNWEMMGLGCAQAGFKVNAIGKEMRSQAGNIFIKLIRDDNGVTTIPRNKSMKEILRLLKNNEIVTVMIDQNMTVDEGVFVDFWGQQACTLPGLAVLALRTGATVLPVYCFRDRDLRHHHAVILPEMEVETKPDSSRQANIIHNTARFTKALESIIREHPEQWLWIHKRWRTRPANEKSSPFIY